MPDFNPYRKALIPLIAGGIVLLLDAIGLDHGLSDDEVEVIVGSLLTAIGVFAVENRPQRI
ncbi:MAG: hypothetical protein M3355_11810 [Actinomycetota bacterium]|nr:hypothetical protein [Actinomycetota bacterium]